MELVQDDKPGPEITDKRSESAHYHYRIIAELFEGCDKAYRRDTIDLFIREILPDIEVGKRTEEAEQEAYDDLLNYLCNNKTVEEVVALTKQIKAVA
jgi:hypothetical protein